MAFNSMGISANTRLVLRHGSEEYQVKVVGYEELRAPSRECALRLSITATLGRALDEDVFATLREVWEAYSSGMFAVAGAIQRGVLPQFSLRTYSGDILRIISIAAAPDLSLELLVEPSVTA